MSNQTINMGNQTINMGNQTITMGKQTINMGNGCGDATIVSAIFQGIGITALKFSPIFADTDTFF